MGRIIVVRHDTDHPALFGAAAALVAAAEGGQVYWPTAKFDFDRYPDAAQHVADEGELIPSGLIWADRLNDRRPRPLSELGGGSVAVVPLHEAFIADQSELAKLDSLDAEICSIELVDNRFVRDDGSVVGWRDRFGRVQRGEPAEPSPDGLTIAIAGPAKQFLECCPAPLAALADAIDLEAPAAAVRFLDPRELSDDPLNGVDGILLPGGSEMDTVPGQIDIARAARQRKIPVVGLCLGMQSMATAVAREIEGWENANLAEADPAATRHSFVRIESGEYRLGMRTTRTVAGSRLSALLGAETQVLCNHRYRLTPSLHAELARRGVLINALGGTPGQDIADGLEADDSFYMGMQSHPELLSRPGSPHPIIRAFVAEAAKNKKR